MLNIFIFRNKYQSKVKELKTAIKVLKKEHELLQDTHAKLEKEIELLRRPIASASAIRSVEYCKDTQAKLEKEIQLLRSPIASASAIRSVEYEKEIQQIRALWDDSDDCFDETMLI